MRRLFLFLTGICLAGVTSAQEVWTLDRCIRTGLDANISVKSADLNVESSLLEKRRWQYAMLPTVNANVSYGYQFGRTIDPTSNTFIEATTNFSNGQLSASLVLFDGFRIQNSRKQAILNIMASKATSEETRNNIALQIATAYINVLFAEEQLETSRRQSELTGEQLAQVERLVEAGVRPDNDRLVIVSQRAQNDYQVTLQQNAVDQAYLALKQLMQVDPAMDLRIDRPDFNPEALEDPQAQSAQRIFDIALQTQPAVRAAQYQLEASAKSDDIARAGLMPSLRLFGGLSSAYSNNFLDYANPDLSNVVLVPGTPQPVLIDGEQKLLTTYSIDGITFPTLSFTDQLERNFGKNVGLSLQIPLYNNHTSRIAIQQARINEEQARLNTVQVNQQLKTTIEGAVLSSRAARQQYLAAREALDAQRAAFAAVSKRFELGAANPVEFATAKANLDIAENQFIMGKYEYLFRIKVLDFYQGKPLSLN